jgi:hypothetical protein
MKEFLQDVFMFALAGIIVVGVFGGIVWVPYYLHRSDPRNADTVQIQDTEKMYQIAAGVSIEKCVYRTKNKIIEFENTTHRTVLLHVINLYIRGEEIMLDAWTIPPYEKSKRVIPRDVTVNVYSSTTDAQPSGILYTDCPELRNLD